MTPKCEAEKEERDMKLPDVSDKKIKTFKSRSAGGWKQTDRRGREKKVRASALSTWCQWKQTSWWEKEVEEEEEEEEDQMEDGQLERSTAVSQISRHLHLPRIVRVKLPLKRAAFMDLKRLLENLKGEAGERSRKDIKREGKQKLGWLSLGGILQKWSIIRFKGQQGGICHRVWQNTSRTGFLLEWVPFDIE
ncbi:hypothetical protein RUM43_006564 [Polyplax serrata]|uniref:Uncharacterized protein n=1 Tax=Polyplax serrata TaxID=468196 RepID=A0AAN8NXZ0_POLSC